MRKNLLILVLSLITITGFAGSVKKDSVIRIWKDVDNAEFKKFKSELTVFKPEASKNNGASVIICPGGSYHHLGMNREGYEVAQWLNSMGFTAFVLRYRLSRNGYHYPSEIQDLQRSIQIVRENAKLWNLDVSKVGVMGFSAGGHLVGTSAIYFNENFLAAAGIQPKVSLRPDFTVMVYPVVSMHDSIAHAWSKENLLGPNFTKELENKMSLEENLHKDVPPIFIMHAKGDEVVDYRNSVYFFQNLQKLNLPHSHFEFYECAGHGFGISPKRNPDAYKWMFSCEKWFEEIGIKLNR